MKKTGLTSYFIGKEEGALPLCAQIDLTYRCNYRCLHCYCPAGFSEQELSTRDWITILDQMHESGCLWLNISGGEPLSRKDFLEIYSYAKKKGFLITLFTNASLFDRGIIEFLKKYPPYSIEVTLNGITSATYEYITQTKGSFRRALNSLDEIKNAGLPLVIKTNALRYNKDEILKIKHFSEKLLGKGKFRFDAMVFKSFSPLISGSRKISDIRLKPEEIMELEKSDDDFLNARRLQLCSEKILKRGKHFLFQCKIWEDIFFINPYGKLKVCLFTDKYAQDLKKMSLRQAYETLARGAEKAIYKTNSKCLSCDLRLNCVTCPAKAELESGEEESSPEYFCTLTKMRQEDFISQAIS